MRLKRVGRVVPTSEAFRDAAHQAGEVAAALAAAAPAPARAGAR